jgi:hypothetical protein
LLLDDERPRLFQGTELPRLLVMVAIALGGWAAVWHFHSRPAPAPDEPEVVVDGPPPAVPTDRSAEFETVTDKTPKSFRDSAAYQKLLNQARDATPAALASRARRDVGFAHLWERPAHYRGVPIHLQGTARLVFRYESKMSRTGWLYEAWIVTPDSLRNAYVCVFEDAPKGLPIGSNLSERVVFNGYFLKLMKYQAGDVPRAAPLLVGRIGWSPRPSGPGDSPWRSPFWMATAVAVIFTITLVRWLIQFRRSFAPRPRPSILLDRPTDQIEPEALAEWLGSVAEDGESAHEHGHDGSRTG